MTLVWAQSALDDLDEIFAYIAVDSPQNASLVMSRIQKSAERLKSFPFMGRPGRQPNERILLVPSTGFLLTYTTKTKTILVRNVRRGRRLSV